MNPNLGTKIYYCYGNWQSETPTPDGGISHYAGGDSADFKEMAALANSGQVLALRNFATKQMAARPEWLTPYLFAGLAYAGLGDKEKATAMLAHFEALAGPGYQANGCKNIEVELRERLR